MNVDQIMALAKSEAEARQEIARLLAENEALCTALQEAVEFQSAPRGPTIHDYGRWRRLIDAARKP